MFFAMISRPSSHCSHSDPVLWQNAHAFGERVVNFSARRFSVAVDIFFSNGFPVTFAPPPPKERNSTLFELGEVAFTTRSIMIWRPSAQK